MRYNINMSDYSKLKKLNDKELKKKLVEILAYLDSVCQKYKIKYSLIGGSLIGVIRHGGIIPWDDDIDIIMTVPELEKLKKALKKEGNPNYLLLQPGDKGYYYPFSKFVATDTILDEYKQKPIPNYGAFVDIFTLHYIYDDKKMRDKFYKKYLHYHTGIYTTNAKHSAWPRNPKYRLKYIGYNLLPWVDYTQKMTKLYDSLPKEPTKHMISNDPTLGLEHDMIPAEWTKEFTRKKFEGIPVSIFKHYDDILRVVFGDYMQLPPKEKQITHHTYNVYQKEER